MYKRFLTSTKVRFCKRQTRKAPKLVISLREYTSNFDGNGVLSWLQTNNSGIMELQPGKTNQGTYYMNSPGIVDYNINAEQLRSLLGKPLTGSYCSPNVEGKKHFILDLQEYELCVSRYTLRCSHSPGNYFPTFLYASKNKKDWVALAHNANTTEECSWTVSSTTSYRYFKICRHDTRQTLCSGWEMYGDLYESS